MNLGIKLVLLICTIFTVLSVSVFSQSTDQQSLSNVGFEGKWTLKKVQAISGSILPLPRNDTKPDIDMHISLSGLELTIKETINGLSRTSRYFTDGRGEKNPGFTSDFRYESKTLLKGRKLKFERKIYISDGRILKDTQVWELSKDGKKLTVESRSGDRPSTPIEIRIATQMPRRVFERVI